MCVIIEWASDTQNVTVIKSEGSMVEVVSPPCKRYYKKYEGSVFPFVQRDTLRHDKSIEFWFKRRRVFIVCRCVLFYVLYLVKVKQLIESSPVTERWRFFCYYRSLHVRVNVYASIELKLCLEVNFILFHYHFV